MEQREDLQENTTVKSENPKLKKIVRIGSFCLGAAFVLSTILYVLITKRFDAIATCVFSFALLFSPFFVEKVFDVDVNTWLVAFVEFYAVTPVFGYVFKFYYNVFWWDSFMHATGGVVFAILGIFLSARMNKNGKTNLITRAMFAFCFSVTVAVFWEFFEFTSDRLFHTDMQKDTYISVIESYLLGLKPDEIGKIVDIEEVIVNGVQLKGYVDIGLIDTMSDMIIETIGAFVFVVIFALDKDKHALITERAEKRRE